MIVQGSSRKVYMCFDIFNVLVQVLFRKLSKGGHWRNLDFKVGGGGGGTPKFGVDVEGVYSI